MGTILIGTADGLYRFGDAAPRLQGRDVGALAPAAGGGLWALLDRKEVARLDETGSPVEVLPLDGREGLCLVADGTELLVGTARAHLLVLQDGRLEPSPAFDDAPGRRNWYTPWGGPPDTRSLTVAAPGTWLANIHVGGILRSADRGASWTPTLDIDDDVHQVVAARAGGPVVAAAAVGLLVSTDGGATWQRRTDGLHSTYARAVAVASDTVLLSASTGPHGARAALYRAPVDGSAELERCPVGEGWFDGNIDTGWLAAAGDLVAVAVPSGEVGDLYVSADAGRSWEHVTGGLPPPRWVTITMQ